MWEFSLLRVCTLVSVCVCVVGDWVAEHAHMRSCVHGGWSQGSRTLTVLRDPGNLSIPPGAPAFSVGANRHVGVPAGAGRRE